MSLCINDDLIWISIPKCASTTIENAFLKSNLKIQHYHFDNINKDEKYPHIHTPLDDLYIKFGVKKTISIKRNFFDRWLSGMEYFFTKCDEHNIKTKIKWDDIDNDYIYTQFTNDYIQLINLGFDAKLQNKINSKFVIDEDLSKMNFCVGFMLVSQNYWKNNKKTTYEFDINNLSDFKNFIDLRYNTSLEIGHFNKKKGLKNKIIKDDNFKNWVYQNFEKPFVKTNRLI